MSEAKDSVSSVAINEHEIVAGSIDGRLRCYDIRMGQVEVDVIGPSVTSTSPTKQGDSILASSLDSTIRLMDRTDGKCLQAFKAPQYVNTSYRIRSSLGMNDSVVISGSEDGTIFIWDLLEGHVISKLRHVEISTIGHTKNHVVSAVSFCPARKEWASAGGDGNVVVWGMSDS